MKQCLIILFLCLMVDYCCETSEIKDGDLYYIEFVVYFNGCSDTISMVKHRPFKQESSFGTNRILSGRYEIVYSSTAPFKILQNKKIDKNDRE